MAHRNADLLRPLVRRLKSKYSDHVVERQYPDRMIIIVSPILAQAIVQTTGRTLQMGDVITNFHELLKGESQTPAGRGAPPTSPIEDIAVGLWNRLNDVESARATRIRSLLQNDIDEVDRFLRDDVRDDELGWLFGRFAAKIWKAMTTAIDPLAGDRRAESATVRQNEFAERIRKRVDIGALKKELMKRLGPDALNAPQVIAIMAGTDVLPGDPAGLFRRRKPGDYASINKICENAVDGIIASMWSHAIIYSQKWRKREKDIIQAGLSGAREKLGPANAVAILQKGLAPLMKPPAAHADVKNSHPSRFDRLRRVAA